MSMEEALYCYGMSKMTVVKEINQFSQTTTSNYVADQDYFPLMYNSYFELHFVEFLELIARIANQIYTYKSGDPNEKSLVEYTLVEKIELLLERLIRTHVPYFILSKPTLEARSDYIDECDKLSSHSSDSSSD